MNTKEMINKLVLVRNSVSGPGLELAKTLLKEGVKVMINGPEQNQIVKTINSLAKEFKACMLYGVPGTIMSVEEYEKFYGKQPLVEYVISA